MKQGELSEFEELPPETLSSTARTRDVIRALNLTSKTVRGKIRASTLNICKEDVTDEEIANYFSNPDVNIPCIIVTGSIDNTGEPGDDAMVIYITLRDPNDIVYYYQATYLLETQQLDLKERHVLSVPPKLANLISLGILPSLHQGKIYLPNNYILSSNTITRIIGRRLSCGTIEDNPDLINVRNNLIDKIITHIYNILDPSSPSLANETLTPSRVIGFFGSIPYGELPYPLTLAFVIALNRLLGAFRVVTHHQAYLEHIVDLLTSIQRDEYRTEYAALQKDAITTEDMFIREVAGLITPYTNLYL